MHLTVVQQTAPLTRVSMERFSKALEQLDIEVSFDYDPRKTYDLVAVSGSGYGSFQSSVDLNVARSIDRSMSSRIKGAIMTDHYGRLPALQSLRITRDDKRLVYVSMHDTTRQVQKPDHLCRFAFDFGLEVLRAIRDYKRSGSKIREVLITIPPVMGGYSTGDVALHQLASAFTYVYTEKWVKDDRIEYVEEIIARSWAERRQRPALEPIQDYT